MGAESRALWLGANPGSGQELTIYENPAIGGPAAPCTAPLASNGVTSSDHVYNGQPTVNTLNSATALGLSGVAQADVTAVSVKVTDSGAGTTAAFAGTLTAGAGSKTWTATVVAGAADYTRTSACPIAPATLAAGSNCTISVTFAPSGSGDRPGAIAVADNAAGGRQTIGLSGTGTAAPVAGGGAPPPPQTLPPPQPQPQAQPPVPGSSCCRCAVADCGGHCAPASTTSRSHRARALRRWAPRRPSACA